MKREGINRFTDTASIIRVQDAMIRDQGVEPTPTLRWQLEAGTFNVWEIYLCLLLAHVESYRSMTGFFALPPLDNLLTRNNPVLATLKTLRDKLLHPTKDVRYQDTLALYFREVKQHYPTHFLFAKHLQTLLDQYLRSLRDHLVTMLSDEIARLPDNELAAFLSRHELDLRRALARAGSATDKQAIEEFIRDHDQLTHDLKLDPHRRNDPLGKKQQTRLSRLHSIKMRLYRAAPLPTTHYNSPAAVQLPLHETLSSYIPIPSQPNAEGFYRGSVLPRYLKRAQREHVTLIFRSTLLLSESLHNADAILQHRFLGKSRSEISELEDWPSLFPMPTTMDELREAEIGTAPGMVALALLADPLRLYRSAISAHPELQIPELQHLATANKVKQLLAWRNTVFHVPDARAAHPYRIETEFLEKFPLDPFKDLVSGLWRFFLRGDGLRDFA